MITRGASLISRLAVFFAVLFFFTACGGGGGGSSFFEGTDDDLILTIALLDAEGKKIRTVTEGAPATVRVKFNKNGDNVLVSANTTAGVLLSGTALTNDNGQAFFTLQIPPGTPKGAGVVTASAEGLTASIDFEVGEGNLRLGHFDEDGTFIEGVIGVAPQTTLSAGGRAQLSVAVLDEDGVLVNSAEQVLFSSGCLSSGLSALDSANPLTTVNGQVSTVYQAEGCSGVDSITASVVAAAGQAFAELDIAPPEASGVTFLEADPTSISIRGTGGFTQRKESSDVFFQVVDANGTPVQGVTVKLSLSSGSSSASLSPTSAVTASNGQVFTTLSSGLVGAVVRVIATIELENGVEVSTISDAITISSGLPVQKGISLSVKAGEGFVVENGMTQDGVQRILTVTLLDAFSQPVPNGTEARFETEFGSVDKVCRTGQQNGEGVPDQEIPDAGKCSVLWSSSSPREPAGAENQDAVQTTLSSNSSYDCDSHNGSSGACPDDLGYTRGGRSTVHVYALGEETFLDSNNNGSMEPAESDDFENLPEASLDKNEDGVYTPQLCDSGGGTNAQCLAGSEEDWVDLNVNGQYDLNNNPAVYNGFACPPDGDGVYCSRDPVNVRADTVLILSAPDLGTGDLWNITLAQGSAIRTSVEQDASYKAYISDLYNNRPPAGSTITVSSSGGCTASPTDFTVGNSQSPGAFTIDVDTNPALVRPEDNGTITIQVNPVNGAPVTKPFTCNSACKGAANDPSYCPDPCAEENVDGDPPQFCLDRCDGPNPGYCLDLCDGGVDEPDWCPAP